MGNVTSQKEVPIIVTLPEGHRLHYLREEDANDDDGKKIQLAVFRVVDLYEHDQYVGNGVNDMGDGAGDIGDTVRGVCADFKRNDDTRMLTFYATRILGFPFKCNREAERKRAVRVNALFRGVKFSYELLIAAADEAKYQAVRKKEK